MRRRFFLLTPIAALISACVGSGADKPAADSSGSSGGTGSLVPSTGTAQTGGAAIPASFPTVHWIHATH